MNRNNAIMFSILLAFSASAAFAYVPVKEQDVETKQPMPSKQMAEHLVNLLVEKGVSDEKVAGYVRNSLKEIGEPAVEPLLKKLDFKMNGNTKFLLVSTIGHVGIPSEQVNAALKSMLNDDEVRVSEEAAGILMGFGYKAGISDIPLFLAALKKHNGKMLGSFTCQSIKRIGEPALEPLLSGLDANSPSIYKNILLSAVSEIKKPSTQAFSAVKTLLGDNSKDIRFRAIATLVTLGYKAPASDIPFFLQLIERFSNDETLCKFLSDRLNNMGEPALKTLVDELAKRKGQYQGLSSSAVNVALINSIGENATAESDMSGAAVKILTDIASSSQGVRLQAVAALRKFGLHAEPALPMLVGFALSDSNIEVRIESLKAMGLMGGSAYSAIPVLKTLMTAVDDGRQHGKEEVIISLAAAKALLDVNPVDRSPISRIFAGLTQTRGEVWTSYFCQTLLLELGPKAEKDILKEMETAAKQNKAYYNLLELILKRIRESQQAPKKGVSFHGTEGNNDTHAGLHVRLVRLGLCDNLPHPHTGQADS